MTLTLDDRRIPLNVTDLCRLAVALGHQVDAFESAGNVRLAQRVTVCVWVPWASVLADSLRALGARNTAPDVCAAQLSEDHQCVTWEESLPTVPALFKLVREEDATGVSGTGHVADGVLWHDGSATVHWRTQHTSTTVYATLADVVAIHGHGGKTRVVWA